MKEACTNGSAFRIRLASSIRHIKVCCSCSQCNLSFSGYLLQRNELDFKTRCALSISWIKSASNCRKKDNRHLSIRQTGKTSVYTPHSRLIRLTGILSALAEPSSAGKQIPFSDSVPRSQNISLMRHQLKLSNLHFAASKLLKEIYFSLVVLHQQLRTKMRWLMMVLNQRRFTDCWRIWANLTCFWKSIITKVIMPLFMNGSSETETRFGQVLISDSWKWQSEFDVCHFECHQLVIPDARLTSARKEVPFVRCCDTVEFNVARYDQNTTADSRELYHLLFLLDQGWPLWLHATKDSSKSLVRVWDWI